MVVYNSLQRAISGLQRRRNELIFSEWNSIALQDRATIAVYPRIGLIYNRIKKSGNTTITAFLADLEHPDRTYDTATAYKQSQLHFFDLSFADVLRARNFPTVAFVRNPYARILSAFRDKIGSGKNDIHRSVPGFSRDDPDGFLCFLKYLENSNIRENRHWWLQADLLARPIDKMSVVGKLENIVEDMASVLALIGQDPAHSQTLIKAHAVSRHTTGSQSRLATYYNDPATGMLVRKLYKRDFSLFGYNADDYPSS